MKAALPGVVEWASCQEVINRLRMVKSPRELAAIRTALRINDELFAHVLPWIRPGMTEWDIRVLLRRNGCEVLTKTPRDLLIL